MRCTDYIKQDNQPTDWCGRYQIHLDTQGHFCERCQNESTFRDMLTQQAAVRLGTDCAVEKASALCRVFNILTDPVQCVRCREDALFRAFLRGQGLAQRQASTPESCANRGEEIRRESRRCCNGREQEIIIFACARRGEAHEGICRICGGRLRRRASDDDRIEPNPLDAYQPVEKPSRSRRRVLTSKSRSETDGDANTSSSVERR